MVRRRSRDELLFGKNGAYRKAEGFDARRGYPSLQKNLRSGLIGYNKQIARRPKPGRADANRISYDGDEAERPLGMILENVLDDMSIHRVRGHDHVRFCALQHRRERFTQFVQAIHLPPEELRTIEHRKDTRPYGGRITDESLVSLL